MQLYDWLSASNFTRAAEFVFSRATLLVTLVVVLVVSLVDWKSTTAIIDDFDISSALSKDGVTPDLVSRALDSRLREIKEVADTAMQLKPLSIDKPPQFIIPGTGVSLSFLIEQVKGFLSVSQWRVGGAILTLKDQMQTVVRIDVSDKVNKTYDDAFDETAAANCISNQFAVVDSVKNGWPELNAQLSCAAEFILKYTQPYILAVYYKEIGNIKAAKELSLFTLYHPPVTDDHWALNLLGSIAYDEARQSKDAAQRSIHIKEAEDYFQRSKDAYQALKSYRIVPPFVLTYVNRGALLEFQQQYGPAKQLYQKAIDEDPSYGISYSNLAGMLARQAKTAPDDAKKSALWKEAIDKYQEGERVAEAQQKAALLTSWAQSLYDLNMYSEAQEKLNSAIAAYPTYADAYHLRAKIFNNPNNPDKNQQEASDALATAAKLKPWVTSYAIDYAKILSDNNKLEESITEFGKIIKREPANTYVISQYANTLAGTIKEKPERYLLTLDEFYRAYDLTAKSDPTGAPAEDIGKRVLDFVDSYLRLAADAARTDTDIKTIKQNVLLDTGDKFLRGGYLLANDFYGRAVTIASHGKPADDPTVEKLTDAIIQRLLVAADNSTAAKQPALIDLAWQYKREDETLVTKKFMTLVASDAFSEARSFASQWCGGKNDFEATVRRQLDASWNCAR